MRFSSVRTKSDDRTAFTTADVVLQLGDSRIPLKAEKVLGAAAIKPSRADSSSTEDLAASQSQRPHNHQHSHSQQQSTAQNGTSTLSHAQHSQSNSTNGTLVAVNEEEARALHAFSRMQESFAARPPPDSGGQRIYWSPDDLSHSFARSTDSFLNTAIPPASTQQQSIYDTPLSATYHDLPTQQPQSTVFPPAGDFGMGPPTIFDSFSGTLPGPAENTASMRGVEEVRRSQTLGPSSGGSKSSRRPRKLDLANFFPQKHSSNSLSPGHGKSPSSQTDTSDHLYPTPPTTGSLGGIRRPKTSSGGESITLRPLSAKKELEGDIFDPKTNVRRPPKGIQNWFDAYLTDDEDEEGDDEDEDELDSDNAGVPIAHELPGEEVAPPAYDGPNRMQTNRSTDSSGTSHSSASIDRKHSGGSQGQPSSQNDSVLSVTSSESDLNSYNAARRNHSVPQGRPQQYSMSMSLPRPHHIMRSYSHESLVLNPRDVQAAGGYSAELPIHLMPQSRDKPLPLPPGETLPLSPRTSSGSMASHSFHHNQQRQQHRMNSQSSSSHTHTHGQPSLDASNTTISEGTFDSSTAHTMVVTEEEMLLLDMMRRKRAAEAQMSFSEGYELALRRESQRSDTRSQLAWSPTATHPVDPWAREPQSADRRLPPNRSWTVSVPPDTSEELMRRQLSAIRKEDVDNALKMERFLSMQAPPVLTSMHPAEMQHSPVELPAALPGQDSSHDLPSFYHQNSTQLSGRQHSSSMSTACLPRLNAVLPEEYDSDSSCYATGAVRNKKYRASSVSGYHAPPPAASAGTAVNVGWHPNSRASMAPSPVPEEDPVTAGQAGAGSSAIQDEPRQSIDRVVMRDDPRLLPLEIQMMAKLLAQEQSGARANADNQPPPSSEYAAWIASGNAEVSPGLARSPSAASFLTRQDSTKHLAHLRPTPTNHNSAAAARQRPEATVPQQSHRRQFSGSDATSPLSALTCAAVNAPPKKASQQHSRGTHSVGSITEVIASTAASLHTDKPPAELHAQSTIVPDAMVPRAELPAGDHGISAS